MQIQASDIKLIQKELKEAGLYDGAIDGKRETGMDAGIHKALTTRTNKLPNDWETWNSKRKMVALIQLVSHENEIDAGVVDGFFGPTTENAADLLRVLIRDGALPRPFSDIKPIHANPHGFPFQSEAEITAFYGPHGIRGQRRPPLVKVPCPWTLTLDWEPFSKRGHIFIHEKLADSLAGILQTAFNHYGQEGIKKHGLDRFGGDYNPRKIRGGNTWSTHAWGISIDWFPSRNKLKWRSFSASLAHPDLDFWWELWEKEGWVSLGRTEDRDWMHVQAAKRQR